MNPHIFREYDIRGVVDEDLTGDTPELIGQAFASELRARHAGSRSLTIVVGHDNRPSSPSLAAGVIRGIRRAGVSVIDVGTVPTPALYFATVRYATDGGVQITGSHNPPEYNGFKLVADGRSFYGASIQRLRERIANGELATGEGNCEARDVLPAYLAHVTSLFQLERPVHVVVDCGNGTGSLVAVELLERLGARVTALYCESDGTFPHHHPDPVVDANLTDLIARVRAEGAEAGIAFDGDADRIGAVDERGRIVRGDMLLLLLALDLLEREGPGHKMVFDVKCSQAVGDVYREHGGKPIMWKTGHSLMKEKMKEVGAPIAGELSGHICFAENFGFDDALFAACRLIDLLARSNAPLSALVDAFPAYVSTPEIRVDVPEERKFAIVADAVRDFGRDHEVIDIDGARVLFDGGWGLLRASNTQPVLVLRFEARTSERLAEIRAEMDDWLRRQGVIT